MNRPDADPLEELRERATARLGAAAEWTKIECSLYEGVLQDGYAVSTRNQRAGRSRYLHVTGWEDFFEEDKPEGMVLDHLCRNRNCLEPFHLELVTPKENTLRGKGPSAENARKENCPKCGGVYAVSPDGKRYCPHCKRQTQNARRKAAGGRGGMGRVG